jgi:extradiol dioxygenase family protein
MAARFHLSFFVADLEKTRRFYAGVLGCPEGRVHGAAANFSFFGHQLTVHADPARVGPPAGAHTLDGNHFGAIVDDAELERLRERLVAAGVTFLVPPQVQHEGTPRERRKMIFLDPSGHAIELKSYRDETQIFAAG